MSNRCYCNIAESKWCPNHGYPNVDIRTRSQRWADYVTAFSGSWAFIGWFATICVFWIVVNSELVPASRWDPYPFLFLNWVLTIVSTFQNPIILLSQNRQNEVDRERMREIVERLERMQLTIDAIHAWRKLTTEATRGT